MICIISPAKSLDFEKEITYPKYSIPQFLAKAEPLVKSLRKKKPEELQQLMNISENLAQLNYERYQLWHNDFTEENARPAVLAFKGDVYEGMQAWEFDAQELNFTDEHLIILSGLYGHLRPLDLIQPYRLEMGTKLSYRTHKNLYEYWKKDLPKSVQKRMDENNGILINLASDEYFKAIQAKNLKGRIIQPVFKDLKGDQYKVVSFFAKKARGMMMNYIIKNHIQNPEELKLFTGGNYQYTENLSTENQWVFTR